VKRRSTRRESKTEVKCCQTCVDCAAEREGSRNEGDRSGERKSLVERCSCTRGAPPLQPRESLAIFVDLMRNENHPAKPYLFPSARTSHAQSRATLVPLDCGVGGGPANCYANCETTDGCEFRNFLGVLARSAEDLKVQPQCRTPPERYVEEPFSRRLRQIESNSIASTPHWQGSTRISRQRTDRGKKIGDREESGVRSALDLSA